MPGLRQAVPECPGQLSFLLSYIVHGLQDIEVVLYDNDCVSLVHKLLQHSEQNLYVFGVQAGCRFVKDVKGVAGALSCEFCGKFHPLAFASRESDRRLPELHISESDIREGLEFLADGGDVAEESVCLAYRHLKHIVDVFPFVFDGKGIVLGRIFRP